MCDVGHTNQASSAYHDQLVAETLSAFAISKVSVRMNDSSTLPLVPGCTTDSGVDLWTRRRHVGARGRQDD